MGKDHCDYCIHYVYDEEIGCYYCQRNLDEDEMARFMMGSTDNCHYFHLNDDYKIVRKQM
ncbi:MAG: hypothetical protein GX306_13960 [Clostridiales bacterium]|nr:hypothetical protein [Clostridiales bacterium]